MKKYQEGFFDEFPEALNPELFKTHIDFEGEEKMLKEERKIRKEAEQEI